MVLKYKHYFQQHCALTFDLFRWERHQIHSESCQCKFTTYGNFLNNILPHLLFKLIFHFKPLRSVSFNNEKEKMWMDCIDMFNRFMCIDKAYWVTKWGVDSFMNAPCDEFWILQFD